eukprot:scaffold2028_cov74-Cyclotella_meneghiniana.AAC.3
MRSIVDNLQVGVGAVNGAVVYVSEMQLCSMDGDGNDKNAAFFAAGREMHVTDVQSAHPQSTDRLAEVLYLYSTYL